MALLIATALLTLALAAGATLAWLHQRQRRVPLAAGLAHGATGTAGTAALGVAVWSEAQPVAVNSALLCFALVLVGGVFVLLFRLQGEAPPGFMVVLHGAVAVTGLALLWIGLG